MSAGAQTSPRFPPVSREEVLAALESGAVLVAGGRRLARSIRAQYHQSRLAAGERAWRSPAVLAWSAWTETLLAQLDEEGAALLRLSSGQERLLWERIVAEAAEEAGTRPIAEEATARAAAEAWDALHAWRLGDRDFAAPLSSDVAAFLGWAERFRTECDAAAWLDRGRAIERLIAAAPRLRLPEAVLVAGFDEFSPAPLALLDAVRAAGASVRAVDPASSSQPPVVRYAFDSGRDELRAAAEWARELTDAGQPGPIGVIVPRLSERRAEADRVFREAFDAPSLTAGAATGSPAFQIAAGMPLARDPAVRAALLALRLSPGETDFATVGAWLRSEYLAGGEAERQARARVERRLREEGAATVRVAGFVRPGEGCDVLRAALRGWERLTRERAARAPLSAWADHASQLLVSLGWPGGGELSPDEAQACAAWREVLTEFASLGAASGPVAWNEALHLLRRMAEEKIFQPEGPAAPVEVLGPLDAAGAEFSHLWIAGLDDETWPEEARPNPFLPYDLQRRCGMPHASPEHELAFARRRFANLLAASGSVAVSSARADGDRELGPSPLIAAIPETPAPAPRTERAIRTLASGAADELFEDEAAPPPAAGETQRGGSRIFGHQAHCPFRAFAELRLEAEPLPAVAPGLDARDRGTLVHVLMEALWREVRDSETLARLLDTEEIGAAIDRAVETALASLETPLAERFRRVEARRLADLALEWLGYEDARSAPFAVAAEERRRNVTIGGIAVTVQIDRVDAIEGGGHVLIDYKTGQTRASEWDRERPLEPQVPLYAVTHDAPVAGALFASLKPGALGFKGVADASAGIDPGRRGEDGLLTQERLAGWRERLEALAAEYLSGRAAVDPRDGDCGYCQMGPLCRVAEFDLDPPGEEREEEAE